MAEPAPNKHERKSAQTRDKLIAAAEQLYGSRSIDAVSLREITALAGQKNPNALQYHFRNRDGLLQAIVDRHSARVKEIRGDYFQRAADREWEPAEAAARCMVMPIVEYVDSRPEAINFVRIVSQLTALNQAGDGNAATGIRFPAVPELKNLLDAALTHLPPKEAQRRVYLTVNTTFHAIADIYRELETANRSRTVAARKPMVEQLICLVESFFAAPAKEGRR